MSLAAQVQPPLTQKEITILFVNTLQAPYYDRLVGNASKNFADMVISGEMIENAIKNGKLEREGTSNTERNKAPRKKEEDVQTMEDFIPYSQFPSYQSCYPTEVSPSLYPYLRSKHLTLYQSLQQGLLPENDRWITMKEFQSLTYCHY
jgi:hypothetical protein